ncbi:hypothetical protein VKT23_007289 [Stygiomarasmius scandens]|uniref:Uncharacterized protein n=1 Tax=Marasmiellus scandens TaxID=2682957 RepID=A0ABR1JJE5_9AGAR
MRFQIAFFFTMMLLAALATAAPSMAPSSSISEAAFETPSVSEVGSESERTETENSSVDSVPVVRSYKFFDLFKRESTSQTKPIHRRSIRRSRHP